jgi:hypothetical protein
MSRQAGEAECDQDIRTIGNELFISEEKSEPSPVASYCLNSLAGVTNINIRKRARASVTHKIPRFCSFAEHSARPMCALRFFRCAVASYMYDDFNSKKSCFGIRMHRLYRLSCFIVERQGLVCSKLTGGHSFSLPSSSSMILHFVFRPIPNPQFVSLSRGNRGESLATPVAPS